MSNLPTSGSFDIQMDGGTVRAWSDIRLPFEPKGEVLEFRDALRAAVKGLARAPHLHASYVSADTSLCDLDNVLLYNVSYSPFRGLGQESVLLERVVGAAPAGLIGVRPHHATYAASSVPGGWRTWKSRQRLVSWTSDRIPLRATMTASEVWRSIRRGLTRGFAKWDGKEPLALVVNVESSRMFDIVPIVKPIVDGIIAAAHTYEGEELEETAVRLATALDEEPAQVESWLRYPGAALGAREVVHLRADGVQWAPADHQLVAIAFKRVPAAGETDYLSSELHSVASTP